MSARLPADPDVVAPTRAERHAARPPHLRWRYVGVVALGGAVGTAGRDLLGSLFPAHDGVSWAIFAINVVGALLLGVLLESLALRGPDAGRRRTLRLLLGTGVMGGFTTYSSLAAAAAALLLDGRWTAGSGYALLTVVVGAVATLAGLAIGAAARPRSTGATA